ncbi:hypothetical protein Bca52824_023127 [Brassica carinata]|uniref:Uncharacterized protein n=1 Tax=Brassica carinata TaxID=52824 RepID=A0A8X7VHM3_BRACI|nr:hypothetical protein Bca52824_023127 [Brassica carinata]
MSPAREPSVDSAVPIEPEAALPDPTVGPDSTLDVSDSSVSDQVRTREDGDLVGSRTERQPGEEETNLSGDRDRVMDVNPPEPSFGRVTGPKDVDLSRDDDPSP